MSTISKRQLGIKKALSNNLFWAGILLAQFVLFYTFSKIDAVVSFFEGFFEIKKNMHLQLFSWILFSAGDIGYTILLVTLLYLLLLFLFKRNRSKTIREFLITLNIFYLFYQFFWGMLYFQKPIIEKLTERELYINDAKKLALIYLDRCKQTRTETLEDENGVFKIENLEQVQEKIRVGQSEISSKLNRKKPVAINSIKNSLFSDAMSYSGILGYYNPFTAEAQYNAALPDSYIPFTIAHESAHQMGYAREQEANFIGYLSGVKSSNISLRYSTEYFVLKSLLNAIAEEDLPFVENVISNYSPAMKRDRANERQFVRQHQSVLETIFGYSNDLFLKSNQQDGSITYSYFVELLLLYETP